MYNLKISESKDYFIKDGKGFFYLADTIWSAFTNVTIQEWEEYLEYRRMQGFNALQISILPITKDASETELEYKPFDINENGKYDYTKINEIYFERAGKMVEIAVNKGFIPALVVLWLDYAPDNWGSKRDPELIMPLDMVKTYSEYVVKVFSKYNPIYIISGDTNFESEATSKHYLCAMDTIKSLTPEAITTMHLSGGNSDLPEAFIQSPNLDFYMYQSGHMIEHQDESVKLAEKFFDKAVKRPIVNSEPCYEGHGHGGRYGRFNAFDIRKAVWQSLLSGAKAGVTYGVHGIWSWHKKHLAFNNEVFSSTPYEWRTALRLKGAWDASFAKWLFETYDLFDIEPCQQLVKNDTREIRMSASNGFKKIAIYIPYSTRVNIAMDLSAYELVLVNLEEKLVAKPDVSFENDMSVIAMPDFNADMLLVGIKK